MNEIDAENIECSNCLSNFHRKHLATWFLKSHLCPICKEPFNHDILHNLRPHTMKEMEELKGLNNNYDIYFSLDGQTSNANYNFTNLFNLSGIETYPINELFTISLVVTLLLFLTGLSSRTFNYSINQINLFTIFYILTIIASWILIIIGLIRLILVFKNSEEARIWDTVKLISIIILPIVIFLGLSNLLG